MTNNWWRFGLSMGLCLFFVLAGAEQGFAQSSTASIGGANGAAAGETVIIQNIAVQGNQRIETATVKSYLVVREGDPYDPAIIDRSLKTLFSTGLFADVTIRLQVRTLVVTVVENPIINRVLFIGNKAIDKEKLTEEVKLRPRVVYTRTKVEDDVEKIVELYRRAGRFAAEVRPSLIQLPHNRVDLVFDINEGSVTGIRRINFIGNQIFDDTDLRGVVVTKESRWWNFFSSNDNYDPDRITYDRELLRQHYLANGYADFRVVSAVAELTPDRKDFYVTFTVEEGEKYVWGEIDVTTKLEALNAAYLKQLVPFRTGEVYNSKKIEDTIESLTFAAGAAGYAFVDIRPNIKRDKETKKLNITFEVNEGPRVYVERINVVGNTRTLDHVIRREIRLVEGDAYNKVLVNQSKNRIRALGFFKEVEVTEEPGSTDDRTVLSVQVEEQPTGELSFGFGFSSTDNFLGEISVSERNLLGRGQFLRLRLQLSDRREQIDVRFSEPYLFGRNLAGGFELFRVATDFEESSFNTNSTGFGLNTGFPLSRNARVRLRYTMRNDEIEVDQGLCTSGTISATICAAEGKDLSSIFGYTVLYDRRNDPIKPSSGFDLTLSQDIAGLGGDINYLRTQFDGGVYRGIAKDVIASFNFSAGYIQPFGSDDDVRLNDRFFRGGNSFRGFDTAGVGPRDLVTDDALGGRAFAIGSFEVSFPTGLPEDLGISASLFADFGAVGILKDDDIDTDTTLDWVNDPLADLNTISARRQNVVCTGGGDIGLSDAPECLKSDIFDDEFALRASAGLSVFWDSPFGPVRFDLAHTFLKEDYDEAKAFRFTAGTRF